MLKRCTTSLTRIPTLALAFALFIILVFNFHMDTVAAVGTGEFDLDVIFVIDNSGSMQYADRDKLALTAAKLFIDMCRESDSRAGYVMYTHVLGSEKPLSKLSEFADDLKAEIGSATYQSNGDTDIALGLEKAIKIFKDDPLAQDHRKAIILLTDGKIDLPKGPRTNDEAKAAMDTAIDDVADAVIPVYTIGLNNNNSVDKEILLRTSKKTGANSYIVTTANQLTDVLQDIYSDLHGAEREHREVIATGEPQSVSFEIPNNSIFKVDITIMSKDEKMIKDVYLKDSSLNTVNYTWYADTRYVLLSVPRPSKDTYTLTFTGTKGDTVSIDLIRIYDIILMLNPPSINRNTATFTWEMQTTEGKQVSDPYVSVNPKLTIINRATNVLVQETSNMTVTLPDGDYIAYIHHEENGINKTSNEQAFTVSDVPATPSPPTPVPPQYADAYKDGVVKIKLMTMFWKDVTRALSDYIVWDSSEPILVQETGDAWADVVDYNYDETTEAIHISALEAGKCKLEITVSGKNSANSIPLVIEVTIISGWWVILFLVLVVLLIALVMIKKKLNAMPSLNKPFRNLAINPKLPPSLRGEISNALFPITDKRGSATLYEIIAGDPDQGRRYIDTLVNIEQLLNGVVFRAKSATEMSVTVPAISGYDISARMGEGGVGTKVSGTTTYIMKKGNTLTIVANSIESDDERYTITLKS